MTIKYEKHTDIAFELGPLIVSRRSEPQIITDEQHYLYCIHGYEITAYGNGRIDIVDTQTHQSRQVLLAPGKNRSLDVRYCDPPGHRQMLTFSYVKNKT